VSLYSLLVTVLGCEFIHVLLMCPVSGSHRASQVTHQLGSSHGLYERVAGRTSLWSVSCLLCI